MGKCAPDSTHHLVAPLFDGAHVAASQRISAHLFILVVYYGHFLFCGATVSFVELCLVAISEFSQVF
jgi:hypothetical protein